MEKKYAFIILFTALVILGAEIRQASAADPVVGLDKTTAADPRMTVELFRQVVALPADAVPLSPAMAKLPLWKSAAVSNVMTYAAGKVVRENIQEQFHSVNGKYVVCTAKSEFYAQTMYAVLAAGSVPGTYKLYSLYGSGAIREGLVEADVTYDFVHHTYEIRSAYSAGFTELTTGAYTYTTDTSKTEVSKNDVHFLSREVTARKVE